MKTLLYILFFTMTSLFSWGQSCSCDKNTLLKQIISCNPQKLDNNSKLYWNFNCDSSWLTFENALGNKKILYSLEKDFIELTTRVGHVDFLEFNNAFLYENKVVSGCCDPIDYYLYDKTSGDSINYLGRAIYVGENKNIPFVVSITNSNYDKKSNPDFKSLTIYNLDTRKEFKIEFPKNVIEKGIENNQFMFPEYIFETSVIENDILIVKYFTDKYIKGQELKYYTLKIDLKKYSS